MALYSISVVDRYLKVSEYNNHVLLGWFLLYLLHMDNYFFYYICIGNDYFCVIQLAAKVYKDEEELETYIHSDLYGAYDKVRSVMISFIFLLSFLDM